MGRFEVTCQGRAHIIDRIAERFYRGDPSDASLRERAEGLFDQALTSLRAQTPDDWRFTRHPSAHFFVSVVQETSPQPDVVVTDHLKLLGGTYRSSPAGEELEALLCAHVDAMCSGQGALARGETVDEQARGQHERLERMAELYLQDLEAADSAIVHELKTAYSRGAAVGQTRGSQEKLLEDYPHTMILRAVRFAAAHAALPNALLCPREGAPGGLRLWVRQGDTWTRVWREGRQAEMYALFCPLSVSGVSVEEGELWSFNSRGVLRRVGRAQVRMVLSAGWVKPPEYHSETYWTLPTRLDALAIGLDYLRRERAPWMCLREAALAQVVEWVQELALARVKLGDAPAWHRKEKGGGG